MVDKILTVRQAQKTTEHEQSLHDLCECLSLRLSREAVFFVDRNKAFEAMIKKYKQVILPICSLKLIILLNMCLNSIP